MEPETIEQKQEDFKNWSRSARRNKELQTLHGVKFRSNRFLEEINRIDKQTIINTVE